MNYPSSDNLEVPGFTSFIDLNACETEGVGGWTGESHSHLFQEPDEILSWNSLPDEFEPLDRHYASYPDPWLASLDGRSIAYSNTDILSTIFSSDSRSYATPSTTLSSTHQAPAPSLTENSLDLRSNGSRRSSHRLRCPYVGCSHSTPFRGQYELERHVKMRHSDRKPFTCPAFGCFKGYGRTSFARTDKLIAHIRLAHGRVDHWTCPVPGCRIGKLATELMHAHLKCHVERTRAPRIRAIYQALSPSWRNCPLWSCGQSIRLKDLLHHIRGHSKEELESMSEHLKSMDVLLQDGNVDLACPICGHSSSDFLDLYKHLIEIHIHMDSAHALSWRRHIREHSKLSLIRDWSSEDWSFMWEPWLLTMKDYTQEMTLCCPVCSAVENVADSGSITHHLTLLVNDEHIKPYRLQLLRLWPEFATHPVFDDLRSEDFAGLEFSESQPEPEYPPHWLSIDEDCSSPTAYECNDLKSGMEPNWPSTLGIRTSKSEPSSQHEDRLYPFDDSSIPSVPWNAVQGGPLPDDSDVVVEDISSSDVVRTFSESSSKEPWHQCPQAGCTKSFRRPRDLHLHQKAHTSRSQRPHGCDMCGGRFLSHKDLRRHSTTHNGGEGGRYKCDVETCPYHERGFKRKDHLERHTTRAHKVQTA